MDPFIRLVELLHALSPEEQEALVRVAELMAKSRKQPLRVDAEETPSAPDQAPPPHG